MPENWLWPRVYVRFCALVRWMYLWLSTHFANTLTRCESDENAMRYSVAQSLNKSMREIAFTDATIPVKSKTRLRVFIVFGVIPYIGLIVYFVIQYNYILNNIKAV